MEIILFCYFFLYCLGVSYQFGAVDFLVLEPFQKVPLDFTFDVIKTRYLGALASGDFLDVCSISSTICDSVKIFGISIV